MLGKARTLVIKSNKNHGPKDRESDLRALTGQRPSDETVGRRDQGLRCATGWRALLGSREKKSEDTIDAS